MNDYQIGYKQGCLESIKSIKETLIASATLAKRDSISLLELAVITDNLTEAVEQITDEGSKQ